MVAPHVPASLLLVAALTGIAAPRVPAGRVDAGAPTQERRPARPPAPDSRPLRCLTPSGESVSADAVLRDLRDGKDVVLTGRIVEGSLDADQVWPPADERRTSLRVVSGTLRLESCRVDGRLTFPRTVFVKGLELPCTEIRGDLDLTDADLGGGLGAARAHVLGELRLARALVHGPLTLASATADDHVDLTGIRISGPLNLEGAEFRRDVDLSRAVVQALDLSVARVGGRTSLQDLLVLTGLAARETNFVRGLLADGVKVVGRADLSGARGAAGLSLADWTVGSDLFLDLAADGPVTMAGVEVGRDLSLLDGVFQTVTIERLRVGRRCELEGARFKGKLVVRDSDMGSEFTASDLIVDGESEFLRVRFPGEDPMEGARFARAPSLVETVLPRPPTVQSGEEGEGEDDEGSDDDEGDDEP